MRLTLLRHAKAKDRAQWRGSEADRPLTRSGLLRCERFLMRFRSLLRASEIWTSPLRRARHTAELASAIWGLPLREAAFLAAETTPPAGWAALLPHDRDLVLVGHEPDLSAFAAWACGAAQSRLHLRKSGAILLDGPRPAQLRLSALISPQLCQRLQDDA